MGIKRDSMASGIERMSAPNSDDQIESGEEGFNS